VEIPKQSIPKVQQFETYDPTKILARRKSEEKNLAQEESESDNEVTSTPLAVFKIYYPTIDEIVADLGTFIYDAITKKSTKETMRKILKEYGTDKMHLDKSIFIHNTATNHVAIAMAGTTVSQAIK